LSLVFNGSNGNDGSFSPINFSGEGRGVQSGDGFNRGRFSESQIHGREFSSSQISEFVGGHSESFFSFILMGLDFIEIGSENRKSVSRFSSSSINFSMSSFPVIE